MKENKLVEISKEFAVKIIGLDKAIRARGSNNAIINQLLRSGTSIGANIHEANYASSKADFINKLQIALKECYETDYWLDIFCESGIITAEEFDEMKEYCGKIRRMLISSITTAKKNSTERNQTNEA